MRYRLFLLSLLVVVAGAGLANADRDPGEVLVFRDGGVKKVKSWKQVGQMVTITDQQGTLYTVRAEDIDFAKSRLATERDRQPKPTPTPTPKEKSLVELSREAQLRRSKHTSATGEPDPGESLPERLEPPNVPPTPPPDNVVPASTATPADGTSATANPGSASTEPGPQGGATPEPTVAVQAPPPPPAPTPVAAAEPTGKLSDSVIRALPFVAGGVAVIGLAAVGFVVTRRRKPIAAAVPSRSAAADEEEEELFTPAFADDEVAEDLHEAAFASPDEEYEPEEYREEAPVAPRALAETTEPAHYAPSPTVPQRSMFAPNQELQIRIGADVYSCPDLATLSGWVAEGRVIENSEILSAEGTWLMAGSIPDLEAAFEERRQNLGY